MKTHLIAAVCTPLRDDHTLNVESLEAHIEDQWRHGIAGFLLAGTMGLMQLQTDETYRQLIEHGVRFSKGMGEVLVGVGDASVARTRDRIQFVERFDVDGIVALSPFFIKFSQTELIDYFTALADAATKPLYLYDLPGLTGTTLSLQTVETLAAHSNIRGIKCSGAWESTRQLMDRVGKRLRVIPAQPHLIDQLIRAGIHDNLDGIFAVVPDLAVAIAQAAEAGDWNTAARLQQKMSRLLNLLRDDYNIFGGCEAILGARGIACRLSPAPMTRLNADERSRLLSEPLVRDLVDGSY
jgi:4-hydroxy-tetrahydrodipicolinate synthase